MFKSLSIQLENSSENNLLRLENGDHPGKEYTNVTNNGRMVCQKKALNVMFISG